MTARFYFAPKPQKLGPFTLNPQTVWMQGAKFALSGLDYYFCAVMGSNELGPVSAEEVKAAARNSQPFDFPITAVWAGQFVEPRAEWMAAAKAEAGANAPAPAPQPAAPAAVKGELDGDAFQAEMDTLCRPDLTTVGQYLHRICDIEALINTTVTRSGLTVVRKPQLQDACSLLATLVDTIFSNPDNFSQSEDSPTLVQSVGWVIWQQLADAHMGEKLKPSLRPLDGPAFRSCATLWADTADALIRWGGIPPDASDLLDDEINYSSTRRSRMRAVVQNFRNASAGLLPDTDIRTAEKLYPMNPAKPAAYLFESSVGAISHVRRALADSLAISPSAEFVEGMPPPYTIAGFLHRWINDGSRGLNLLYDHRNSTDGEQLIEMFRSALNATAVGERGSLVRSFRNLLREQRPAGAAKDWTPTDPNSAFTQMWNLLDDGWERLLIENPNGSGDDRSEAQSAVAEAEMYIDAALTAVQGITAIPLHGITAGALRCQVFMRHLNVRIEKRDKHPAYIARLTDFASHGLPGLQPLPPHMFSYGDELFSFALEGLRAYLNCYRMRVLGSAKSAHVSRENSERAAAEATLQEAHAQVRAIRNAVIAWRPAGMSEADFVSLNTPIARVANAVLKVLGNADEVERLAESAITPMAPEVDPHKAALDCIASLMSMSETSVPLVTSPKPEIKWLRSAISRTEHLFKLFDALEDSDRGVHDRLLDMQAETLAAVRETLFSDQALPVPNKVLDDVLLSLDMSIDSMYHNSFESILSLLHTVTDLHIRRLVLYRPFGVAEGRGMDHEPQLSKALTVLKDYRDSPEAQTRDIFMLFPQLAGAVQSESLQLSIRELKALTATHGGNVRDNLSDSLLDQYFNTFVEYTHRTMRDLTPEKHAEYDGFLSGPLLREVFPVYYHQPVSQVRELLVAVAAAEVRVSVGRGTDTEIENALRAVADSLVFLLRAIRPLKTRASAWARSPQVSEAFALLEPLFWTPEKGRKPESLPSLCDEVRAKLPTEKNVLVEEAIARITEEALSQGTIFETMGLASRAVSDIRSKCANDRPMTAQWSAAFSDMLFRKALRFQDVRTVSDVNDLIYLMLSQSLEGEHYGTMEELLVEGSISISQLISAYAEMRPLGMTATAWLDGVLMPDVEGSIRTYIGKLGSIYGDHELLGDWLYQHAKDIMPPDERNRRAKVKTAQEEVAPEGLMKYRTPKFASSATYIEVKPDVPPVGLPCPDIFDYKHTVYEIGKVLPMLSASLGGGVYQLDEYILDDLKANSRCLGIKKLPALGNFVVVGGTGSRAQTCIMTVSNGGKKLGLVVVNLDQIGRVFGSINTATVLQALTHEFAHYIHKSLKNTALMDWKRAIAGKTLHPRTGADGYAFETEQFAILAETMVWGNSARGLYKANGINVVEQFFHNNYIPDADRQRLA